MKIDRARVRRHGVAPEPKELRLEVDFRADGNAQTYLRTGWSNQEASHVWSLGDRSEIALPLLFHDAHLQIEVEVEGVVELLSQNLTIQFGTQIIEGFKVVGRSRLVFSVPPRVGDLADIDSIVFIHEEHRKADAHEDKRPLALRFFKISYIPDTPPGLSETPVVLVIGNSHMGALRHAQDEAEKTSAHLPFNARFAPFPPGHSWVFSGGPATECDPRLIEEIRQIAAAWEAVAVVSFAYGNGHFVHGAAMHERPFDFFMPDGSQPAAAGEIVPFSLMHRRAERSTRLLLGFFKKLRGAIEIPIFHASSPPPGSLNSDLLKHVQGLSSAGERENPTIAPPEFRQKMWRVFEQAAQEIVEENGGTYLVPPSGTADDDGYLRPEFLSDGFHANTQYGREIIRQLSQRLEIRDEK